jgi:hypothetical protein
VILSGLFPWIKVFRWQSHKFRTFTFDTFTDLSGTASNTVNSPDGTSGIKQSHFGVLSAGRSETTADKRMSEFGIVGFRSMLCPRDSASIGQMRRAVIDSGFLNIFKCWDIQPLGNSSAYRFRSFLTSRISRNCLWASYSRPNILICIWKRSLDIVSLKIRDLNEIFACYDQ